VTAQLSLNLDKGAFLQFKELCPGAHLLRSFALAYLPQVVTGIDSVVALAPFRHMHTPGGLRMSVAMTNCGKLGWVTDDRGYRYQECDPNTGKPWPAMPGAFLNLAVNAAHQAGCPDFIPDACLINRYEPGARMTLHQDKNEYDFKQPIVSVSLGLPATFLFGGETRAQRPTRIALEHGDTVVWGGPARLRFHGVLPIKDNEHPVLGRQRINLTFRKAG